MYWADLYNGENGVKGARNRVWVQQVCDRGDQESEPSLRLLWWWSHVAHSCRQALHRAMVTQCYIERVNEGQWVGTDRGRRLI